MKRDKKELKIKVLIVDDTRTIRAQERLLLKEMDCEVDEAVDGFDAIDKIRADQPHVVLMDINMPRLDGIEACREIKSDPNLKDIKVIMVTTESEYEHMSKAFQAGCDDYVTKPIDKEELTKKFEQLSDLVRCRIALKDLLA